MIKKKILIDLDGVLNTYKGNYDKDYIEPITSEAYEFIKNLSKKYKIVIFTSRNLLNASKWIIENNLDKFVENVTNIKEPAYLMIDDRCINFDGDFSILRNRINNFQTWYKK